MHQGAGCTFDLFAVHSAAQVISQFIAGGLFDTLNNAAFLHQVAQHQAANQDGGIGQGEGNDCLLYTSTGLPHR